MFSKWEGKGTGEKIQCAPAPFIPAIGILVDLRLQMKLLLSWHACYRHAKQCEYKKV